MKNLKFTIDVKRLKKYLILAIGILLYPVMLLMVKLIKINDKDEKSMIKTYNENINIKKLF